MRRSFLGRALRVLFGLLGLAFLVIAFVRTWDESRGVPLPGWWRLTAAVVLLMVGLLCGARAWSALLNRPLDRRLLAGFSVSQLGKYMPGAVWQAVGQVGYAVRSEVPARVAMVAFGVFAVAQAAAGAAVGASVAVFVPEAPPIVRLGSLAGLGLLVLLHRRWLSATLGRVARWRGAGIGDVNMLPPEGTILRAWAWTACSLLLAGIAFAIVLGGLEDSRLVPTAAAFAFAWTVGFLAVPVPAGLGVREAVLIAALGHEVSAGALVSASVVLRLCFMVAEATMILLVRWLPLPHPGLEQITERPANEST